MIVNVCISAEGLEKHVTHYEVKEHKFQKQNGKSQPSTSLPSVPFLFPTKRQDGTDESLLPEVHVQEHAELHVNDFPKSNITSKPGK